MQLGGRATAGFQGWAVSIHSYSSVLRGHAGTSPWVRAEDAYVELRPHHGGRPVPVQEKTVKAACTGGFSEQL